MQSPASNARLTRREPPPPPPSSLTPTAPCEADQNPLYLASSAHSSVHSDSDTPGLVQNDRSFTRDALSQGTVGAQPVAPPQNSQESINATSQSHEATTPQIAEKSTANRLDQSSASTPRMWQSVWLRPIVLLIFALYSALLLVALVVLYYYARASNGLSTHISKNHYLWTYGPTAVLVLVLTIWRQIDFACRILSPWEKLATGNCAASHALLLDYISPIAPAVIWSACSSGDWDVLATCMGSLLLRLIIIFSTGLLVLSPTFMSDGGSSFIIDTSFSSSTITSSEVDTDAETGSAAMSYYGIWYDGLAYPYGTAGSFAYETITPASSVAQSTLTATVNGFYPDIHCQAVPMTAKASFEKTYDSNNSVLFSYTAHPPDCPAFSGILYGCSPIDETCPASEELFDLETAVYSTTTDYEERCQKMWFWYITQLRYDRDLQGPADSRLGWNVSYTKVTALAYYPQYTIRPLNLSIEVTNHTQITKVDFSRPMENISTTLTGYSATQFGTDAWNNLGFDQLFYGGPMTLLRLQNSSLTESDLLDSSLLHSSIITTFRGYATQFVHQNLLTNTSRLIEGETQYISQRLHVRPLSTWTMFGGLIALGLCSICVLSYRPKGVITRQPNAIITHAAVLCTSLELQTLVKNTKATTSNLLHKTLKGVELVAAWTPKAGALSYSVQPILKGDPDVSARNTSEKMTVKWWRPIAFSKTFQVWAFVSPISVIVVVQILQHLSDTHRGVINVDNSSAIARSAAPLIASLVMTLIAMSYDSVEFAVLSFGPYSGLMKGSANPQHNLLANYAGHIPLYTIWDCIWRRNPIAAISSVAATIGAVLTIIASGLYTVESIQYSQQLSLSVHDQFESQWRNSSETRTGTIIMDLLEHENATYPAYTFNEMAFPRLSKNSLQLVRASSSSTITLNIPARRAALNCTAVPRQNISVNLTSYTPSVYVSQWTASYNFVMDVPNSCANYRNISDAHTSTIMFQVSAEWDNGTEGARTNFQQARFLVGSDFLPPNTSYQSYSPPAVWSGAGAATNLPECPSLGFIYNMASEFSASTENITAYLCSQGFQEVNTTTVFSTSDMTVSSRQPPIIDEASARWVASVSDTGMFLDQTNNWATWYSLYAPTGEQPSPNIQQLDPFFQTVAYGTEAIPFEELLGPTNEERLLTAVQHVYRKYMAQAINANMRVPAEGPVPEYTAVLPASSTHARLVQHNASKIILQVLLGIMFCCNLIVYPFTRKYRRMLPYCPWSLFGVMALLAGSDLCDGKVMPIGAESMSDKELEKALNGWTFSLGWWGSGNSEQGQRYGIDIGRARQSKGDEMDSAAGKNLNNAAREMSKTPPTSVIPFLSDTTENSGDDDPHAANQASNADQSSQNRDDGFDEPAIPVPKDSKRQGSSISRFPSLLPRGAHPSCDIADHAYQSIHNEDPEGWS